MDPLGTGRGSLENRGAHCGDRCTIHFHTHCWNIRSNRGQRQSRNHGGHFQKFLIGGKSQLLTSATWSLIPPSPPSHVLHRDVSCPIPQDWPNQQNKVSSFSFKSCSIHSDGIINRNALKLTDILNKRVLQIMRDMSIASLMSAP